MTTRRFLFLLYVALELIYINSVCAQERFISYVAQEGALLLNAGGEIPFYVDANDERGVRRAAENVMDDLKSVCQAECRFANSASEARIIAGTLGHSEAISCLLPQAQQNLLKGKREQYFITLVGHQLLIAGSDRRGTIFGLYELARQAGVSPWTWWADVAVERHDNLYMCQGEYTDGEPRVRWRGIFLNDEGPCLMQWVKNTYGTNYGDHRFYERVYELILRLKGNFLWPAMWDWAFKGASTPVT